MSASASTNCAECPHQSDCQKIGSCLDEINAAQLAKRRSCPHPTLMTSAQVTECMEALQRGLTIRRITGGGKNGKPVVSLLKFKRHCAAYPGWGAEAARLAEANAKAADALKSPILRGKMHCNRGHSLEGARIYRRDGYPYRFCLECRRINDEKGGILRPEMAEKIKAALQVPTATISSITGNRRPGYLLRHVALQAYRRLDPEIDRLVVGVVARGPASAGHSNRLRLQRIRNDAVREQNNDYYKIRAMLPASMPDRDDVVNAIFEDLLTGALKREDVRARVKSYVAAHNKMFPTKYAKFGDSLLVSLDEALFDDGGGTRGDYVSRGLWD